MTAKTKQMIRRILLTFVIIVLVLVFGIAAYIAVWQNTHNFTKTNLKYYEQFLQTDTVMPRLDALGDTLDLDFQRTRHVNILYTSTAYLLTASYNETEYEMQKQVVLQKYEFETETATNVSGNSFDVRFSVDGFDFGVLSLDRYNGDMPHRFYCIGTSDTEYKIAYLYFTDIDLDVIPSWEDFLRHDCGWE